MRGSNQRGKPKTSWELARRQHGVVARGQLVRLGYSRKAIAVRLKSGRLHRVRLGSRPLRSVYAVGWPDLTARGRWMAAVLACGNGAALSHSSAALLLGIRSAGRPNVEVTIGRDRDLRPSGVRVYRRPGLRAEDLGTCAGIPVTSPTRTLIDLSTQLSSRSLEAAVNAADRLDLVDPDSLRAVIAGLSRERGVPALRRILDRDTFVLTDSELERFLLPIARRAGLPLAETRVWLNGFKVDFFWRELGLVVETDGLRYHRTPAQLAVDRRRDRAHTVAGLTPLRFSHYEVRYEPARVGEELARVARRLNSGR